MFFDLFDILYSHHLDPIDVHSFLILVHTLLHKDIIGFLLLLLCLRSPLLISMVLQGKLFFRVDVVLLVKLLPRFVLIEPPLLLLNVLRQKFDF